MSVDFKQAQSIFLEAVEKTDPEDRARFLDEVCGDDQELRSHLELLLDSHNQSGTFLEQGAIVSPTVNLSALDEPIAEQIGSQIGPYKLLRKIDEGGMGVVYMAQQSEPVARRVALKIIKPGMDTRRVIARFEAERQALAMMDHPNIAKIFDGGKTDSGRPYFVMELVKGIPITQYCDEHHLTPRQRLELFVPVCQAVQHAHQKGIIHRDIKPSNVLVAEYDDRAVPKVIDFGLAKAVDQRLTEKTMFTQFGQVVGTFDYMSPEQTKLNQLDIDTRSDIYSLGVLLYELLTGETPFDRARLRSAAFDELLRIIREEEPPRPSLRLSSSEALPSIAANRHVEPKKLSTLVRGELDWIVMKALEKDRTRRYETANGFARDVQRYLGDEAVEARPPSAGYRFGKFARRNRGLIATAGVIFGVLLAGLASTTWQAIRASRAERSAQASLEKAETQRLRAEANLEQAHQTVRDYLTIVSDSEELALPALQKLRGELLDSALGYYEQFLGQKTDDPHLKLEMAAIYFRVGQIHMDIDQPEEALTALVSGLDTLDQLRDEHPDVALCPTSVSGFWRGFQKTKQGVDTPVDSQVAIASLRRATNLWEEFAAACPMEVGFRADLAVLRMHSAEILLTYMNHGPSQAVLPQGALEIVRADAARAEELLEQLVKEEPEAQQHRADLARAYMLSARVARESNQSERVARLRDRALALHEALVEESPETPHYRNDLAFSLFLAAARHRQAGRRDQAEAQYRRAIELVQGLVVEFPNVHIYVEIVSESLIGLATLLHQQGEEEEAARQLQTAIKIWNQLISRQPLQAARSATFRTLGNVLKDTGHKAEAQLVYQKHTEALEHLLREHPKVPGNHWRLFHAQRMLGFTMWEMGKPDDATEPFKAAEAIIEEMAADFPDDPKYRHWLASNLRDMAKLAGDRGRPEEAEQLFRDALEVYTRLMAEHPEDFQYGKQYSRTFSMLAKHLLRQGKTAEDLYRTALDIIKAWSADFPENHEGLSSARNHLAGAIIDLGLALAKSGRDAEAEAVLEEAIGLRLVATVAGKSTTRRDRKFLAQAHWRLADALNSLNRSDEAETALLRSLDMFEQLAQDYPDERSYPFEIGFNHWKIAWLRSAAGRETDAEEPFRHALEVYQRLAIEFPEDVAIERRRLRSLRMLAKSMLRQGKANELAQFVQEQPDLNRMLELEPKNKSWFYTQLAIYRATGQPERAAAELEQRLATAPNKDNVRQKYGLTLHGMRMLDDAIVAHRQAYEQAGSQSYRSVAMYNLGCAYVLKGDHDQAFEALNKSIELGESRLKMFQGDSDLADLREDERYGQLLEQLEWVSHAEAAREHAAKGELPAATARMSQAIEGYPKFWRPYYELALMQLASGDLAGYRTMCGVLREVGFGADDPVAASFVAWTAALAPKAVDDYDPFISLARQAIDASPENSQYAMTLGAILLRAGQVETAIEKLSAGDKVEKNMSPAYWKYLLAIAQHTSGRETDAGKALQEANAWADRELQKPTAWNRRLTLRILRREAETLIEPSGNTGVEQETTQERQPE